MSSAGKKTTRFLLAGACDSYVPYVLYVSSVTFFTFLTFLTFVALAENTALVDSALGIRTRASGFDSRVVPLFHWVATVGKSFTHIALEYKKGVFGAEVVMVIKCARLS